MRKNNKDNKVVLILHNIRSAYNVGSIFRTADAAGIKDIYITGYTPAPKDNFGKYRKDIAKTALGAEKTIDWSYFKYIKTAVEKLKNERFEIAAVEQSRNSIDYKKYKPKKKTAIILGNEVRGLSNNILDKCDSILEIPMKGKKESLNVSVAAGIVIFRIFNI